MSIESNIYSEIIEERESFEEDGTIMHRTLKSIQSQSENDDENDINSVSEKSGYASDFDNNNYGEGMRKDSVVNCNLKFSYV
jgi:hypothetical protein